MYQGALFRRALELGVRRRWSVYILSGKHGIIRPWTQIDPYDEKRAAYAGPWPRGTGYWVGGKRYFRHAPPRLRPLCSPKAHGDGGGLKCMLAEINVMLLDS